MSPVDTLPKLLHPKDRGPTFWAKRFGMVTDKFGCPWIVNGEMLDVQMQS
jgi:hypothetical protein